MPREILIQGADGQSKTYPLTGDRITLGRSSTTELCFADDAGLSRQHMALERDGEDWTVQDLGSKNGTQVNNIPLKGKLKLKSGDRITAGHLVIVYDDRSSGPAQTGPIAGSVVFFDTGEGESPSTSTVVTSLEGALSDQTVVKDPGGRGAAQVKALIHAGQELATNTPLSELFQKILSLSIEAVGAQRGVVMTLEGDRLVVRANKGEGFRISSAVRDRVLKEKSSLLVKDTQMDDAFRERLSIVEQKVRTLMAVPLQTKDQIIGLIYLDSPFFIREFTVDDLNLLTVMANTAAIRIEHARLVEVEQAERMMARDLAQAADIQRGFLPSSPPVVEGADIAGYNAPCRTVGGDYYDFFSYDNGRVALALGDVSGKGMPASLMMMGLQARVQQALIMEPEDLGAAMTRINKITCPKCPSNRFITFFFCVLDPASGRLAYANAGHNPPLLVRSTGEVKMLEGGGPPLGILSIANYAEQEVTLEPGDLVAIYSDGVSEAQSPKDEEFGEERFGELLAANRTRSAEEIMGAVNGALEAWAEGGPAADDITLVVAKRV
jgi:serine phosphatase RsbU (regulator of sigma subunit)